MCSLLILNTTQQLPKTLGYIPDLKKKFKYIVVMTLSGSRIIIKPLRQAEFLESPDELVCKVIDKVVDLIPVVLYTSRPENDVKDVMH